MKSKTKIMRWFLGTSLLLTIMLTLFVSVSYNNVRAQQPYDEELIDQIIVKLKPGVAAEDMKISGAGSKMSFSMAQNLSVSSGVELTSKRAMSGGAQVMKLPYPMTQSEIEEVIASLNDDPGVEYVEPDVRLYPMATPDDSYYGEQWHYHAPEVGKMGAANLPGAWDVTTGAASIVTAVLDTGLLPHQDIVADLDINDGDDRILQGYDFISNSTVANDGDSTRDSNPTDPGDWCDSRNSTWHGTHVAGTIGALSNNGQNVTGINWNSKILPVRVLGKCGGDSSDVADAIRWAAGYSAPPIPDSTDDANVINLSLGGTGSCPQFMQDAINDAVDRGVVVVVAAGNDGIDAINQTPANCDNVITVAAVSRNGGKASYSNYGNSIDIAAPGGDAPLNPNGILSTLNYGTTVAGADALSWSAGTSMAAPHVAGIVSLLLSVNSSLTPAQVENRLKATARVFPTGTGDDCTTSLCGAGIIDATALVSNLDSPAAWIQTASSANINSTVTLDGSGSIDLNGTIDSYSWLQTGGSTVTLSGASNSVATFTAPASTDTLTFSLMVEDSSNDTDTANVSISITTPPPSDSGGGGGSTASCFIATAAFGTPMQPDVRYLRAFRDEYLLTNTPGQAFVEAYYEYSPPVANKIRKHPMLRSIVRGTLKPLIWLSEALVSDEFLAMQTAKSP